MAGASDSGSSTTDNVTKVTTPTFAGKTEANATVSLFDGATLLGTGKANAAGSWSIKSSTLAQGVHAIIARAIDLAGNTSVLSGALSVTIDTTAPGVPTVPDLQSTSDSGTSNTDNLTNVNMPSLFGKSETNATITLFEGATAVGTGKANAAGNWVVKTNLLSDGAHTLKSRATDAAGNASALSATSLTIKIDTLAAAPSVPDLIAASDTGVSSSDNITSVTTPTLTGTAEANDTVTLFDGATALGSTKANGAGVWSFTTGALSVGAHAITATATDAAGNISAASPTLSVTIDTAATAPSTPDLAAASDSGMSATDNITKVTAPTFVGAAEAGASVTLLDGAKIIGTGVADGSGAWSITASTLANGVHAIAAKAVDLAGNVSVLSGALSVTIDTTAPAQPTGLDLQAASDSGASNTDNITNVTTPVVAGKGEVGAMVSLQEGAIILGSATVDAGGNWTIKSSALSDGVHALKALQSDVAGNVSALSGTALTVTIDTVAPSVAPILGKVTTSSASGTAEANSAVALFDGATPIGSTTTDAGGVWSIPVVLASGNHSLTAKATDVAGNASAPSGAANVAIGTAGGDVLVAAGPDLAVGGAGNDVYLIDNAGDVVTEGVGEGFDTVYASVGYTLPSASEIEFLIANAGPAGVALTGNELANTIFGGAGNDVIAGAGGADMVFGGAGADVFAFLALADSTVGAAGQDVIGDFSALAGDLIGLGGIDANAGLAGDQAFSFIGGAAFSGVAGQLRSEVVSGSTVVSGDVNADSAADFAIRLTGAHALTGTNFVL